MYAETTKVQKLNGIRGEVRLLQGNTVESTRVEVGGTIGGGVNRGKSKKNWVYEEEMGE